MPLPWSAQRRRGEVFASCEVLGERADGNGAPLRARADPRIIERLRARLAARQRDAWVSADADAAP